MALTDTINRIPKGVKNIILINILFFIATLFNENRLVGIFGLFPFGSPFFRHYQIITYMFMHGGFVHIFFNMYTLFMFGVVLERVWGTKKFVLYYFVTGIGAALCNLLVNYLTITSLNQLYVPTVGASGAVYGLLLAYGMLFPDNKLTMIIPFPITIKAKWLVVIWGAIELLLGIASSYSNIDNIAHFAHLGGMLFGFILIIIWRKNNRMYNEF